MTVLPRRNVSGKAGPGAFFAVGCGIFLLAAGFFVWSVAQLLDSSGLGVAPRPDTPVALVVPLKGVLFDIDEKSVFGEEPLLDKTERLLRRAADDANVRAVVLYIDSPGGEMTYSDRIHRAVAEYRKRCNKPVVVMMGSVCASGGYYVACAGEFIMAHPTSVTGSIGVKMSLFNFKGLLESYGVRDETVTPDNAPYKEIGSWTKDMTAEEKDILTRIVGIMHERFIEVVATGRPGMTAEQVRAVANGSIFVAEDAVANGLIDATGYLSDLRDKLKEMTGVAKIELYWPPERRSLGGLFRTMALEFAPAGALARKFVSRYNCPRLMTIWREM